MFSSTSLLANPLSSSSTSTSQFLPTKNPRSMEEVWKDITLSSLHDHSSHRNPNPRYSNSHSFRNLIFQDFLATKHPSSAVISPTTTVTNSAIFGTNSPPPATVLSLNSGAEFHFLENSDPVLTNNLHLQSHSVTNVSCFNTTMPFDALASSNDLPSFGKKRFSESDCRSGDRRHKRMIKNRESAARSRARKQAYTNELELENAHLMEENARLRRQQEQICLAAAAQLPKKHNLHRTSTAPF